MAQCELCGKNEAPMMRSGIHYCNSCVKLADGLLLKDKEAIRFFKDEANYANASAKCKNYIKTYMPRNVNSEEDTSDAVSTATSAPTAAPASTAATADAGSTQSGSKAKPYASAAAGDASITELLTKMNDNLDALNHDVHFIYMIVLIEVIAGGLMALIAMMVACSNM